MENLLICAVFDKITSKFCCLQFCNSKAEYLRNNVEQLIVVRKNLNDLTPYVLGSYNPDTGEIIPEKTEFKFDEYKMPLSKAESLAPLGFDFTSEALAYEQWKKERSEKKGKK